QGFVDQKFLCHTGWFQVSASYQCQLIGRYKIAVSKFGNCLFISIFNGILKTKGIPHILPVFYRRVCTETHRFYTMNGFELISQILQPADPQAIQTEWNVDDRLLFKAQRPIHKEVHLFYDDERTNDKHLSNNKLNNHQPATKRNTVYLIKSQFAFQGIDRTEPRQNK